MQKASVLLIYKVYSAFSFNGEPQAEVKSGNDARDLPLNDEINSPLEDFRRSISSKFLKDSSLTEKTHPPQVWQHRPQLAILDKS
jgi:hypothetical protein